MTYCARYRFKSLTSLDIANGETLSLTVPGLPATTLDVDQDAQPFGKWLVIRMKGLKTEQEALRAGQRLGGILSIAGAVTKLGIDIGFSRSTLQFSEAVHNAVLTQTGRQLRTETHGLMVYKEDTAAIVRVEASGSSEISPEALQERLAEWAHIGNQRLTDRHRTCAALVNDSLFVPQTEGKFILRVSAIEALCDQSEVGPDYQAAIVAIETFVSDQVIGADIRETILRSLAFQKRRSLRQSYMTKFRTLLSEDNAKSFDALYQKRSALVHDGRGRGELADAANEALDLAVTLLSSELKAISRQA